VRNLRGRGQRVAGGFPERPGAFLPRDARSRARWSRLAGRRRPARSVTAAEFHFLSFDLNDESGDGRESPSAPSSQGFNRTLGEKTLWRGREGHFKKAKNKGRK